MKVRFIPRVQRQLFLRGVHGATDAWTVKGETQGGKLVLLAPPRRARKGRGVGGRGNRGQQLPCFVEVHKECVVLN